MSRNVSRLWAPADSIDRSPVPITRSNTVWGKAMSLTRSSGISLPCLATTPDPADDGQQEHGEHVPKDVVHDVAGDRGGEDDDQRGDRLDQRGPVRHEVDDDLFVVVEQLAGEGHRRTVPPSSGGVDGATSNVEYLDPVYRYY